MSSESRRATRADIESYVAGRAGRDEAFRQRLLKSPKEALVDAVEAVTGTRATPPEGLEVRVVEETPTTLYLVLPATATGGELGSAQLDEVSGGAGLGGRGNPWGWASGLGRGARPVLRRQ
jgi:hypothetical protein